MNKQFKSLRIFLSYGHDHNEELVRRIKSDLEQRGHDVWFDKSEIKFGDDWRRSISDGIINSHRVISFLSKHSTRNPGVCRDELAIAIGVKGGNVQTILIESEEEVQPPVNIGYIQWLDMHSWKEKFESEEWEIWYKEKFDEIIRVVESEENKRFAGEIEQLSRHLKPIGSEARICQLLNKGFYGREWLFDAVEKWRKDRTTNSSLFWIMGDPGVGKSAFAAQLIHTRSETVIAAQFCEWSKPDHRDAARVVKSLAFQLATRMHDYRKLLVTLPEIDQLDGKNVDELFEYLFTNPLRNVIDGGRERMLMVIDALDEANVGERNPLVEMLALHAPMLPEWLGIVITSRPENAVTNPLQALNPFKLDTGTDDNRNDISTYLQTELKAILNERSDAQNIVERVLDISEGVFLYVEFICSDLKKGHLSLDRLDLFPKGLGGVFLQFFNRQFPDIALYKKSIRPALRAILAAREPLSVELLRGLLNLNKEDFNELTGQLGSLFPVLEDQGQTVIKAYHKSLLDWLISSATAGNYFVDREEGEKQLTNNGWQQFVSSSSPIDKYFLKWLPTHLLAIAETNNLESLLTDFGFAMERMRAGFLEIILKNYQQISNSKHSDLKEKLKIWVAFFREKSHILRRGNEDWPSYKIFLQLAIEHSDDSPLTIGAEKWLEEGNCDWYWLRCNQRLQFAQINPCIAVFEGHTDDIEGVLETRGGNIISWSKEDQTLRLWDKEGKMLAMEQSRTGLKESIIETRSGNIVVYNNSDELHLWDKNGQNLTRLESQSKGICCFIETKEGHLLTWPSVSGFKRAKQKMELHLRDKNGNPICDLGHPSMIVGAIETREGNLLSWDGDSNIRLWNKNGLLISEVKPYSGFPREVIQTMDGKYLSNGVDSLKLWDTNWNILTEMKVGNCQGVSQTRSGNFLSWNWDEDKIYQLWDKQGAILAEGLQRPFETKDGHFLFGSHHTLDFADGNGKILATFQDHSYLPEQVIETKKGLFISRFKLNTLRLWDINGTIQAVMEGHSGQIFGILETRDGHFISWSYDNTIRLWDNNGNCQKVFEGHTNSINGVIETKEGYFLSWSDDYTLRLWNINGEINVMEGHSNAVTGAIETLEGNFISRSFDSSLRTWDEKGNLLAILNGHSGPITGCLEMENGHLLSWSEDCTLRLWDNVKISGINSKRDSEIFFDILPGNKIVSCEKGTVRIYENTGDLVNVISAWPEELDVAGIGYSTENIIIVSEDNAVFLWGLDKNTMCRIKEDSAEKSEIIIYHGKLLLWNWYENNLRLFDLNGQSLAVMEGHSSGIANVIVTKDGNFLSWSHDKTLRLWNEDGYCLAVMEGHTSNIDNVIETKEGTFLSWSHDNTIRLWEADGKFKVVMKGHNNSIENVIETREGNFLSWCHDTIRLWDKDGACKAIMDCLNEFIFGVIETKDRNFLSWTLNCNIGKWDKEGNLLAKFNYDSAYRELKDIIETKEGFLLLRFEDSLELFDKDIRLVASMEESVTNIRYVYETRSGQFVYWNESGIFNVWDSNENQIRKCTLSEWAFELHKHHSEDYCYYIENLKTIRSIPIIVSEKPEVQIAFWNAENACEELYFFKNGTAVVKINSRLSFLQLYKGNEKAGLEWMEKE